MLSATNRAHLPGGSSLLDEEGLELETTLQCEVSRFEQSGASPSFSTCSPLRTRGLVSYCGSPSRTPWRSEKCQERTWRYRSSFINLLRDPLMRSD
jgi:hypothetical protein